MGTKIKYTVKVDTHDSEFFVQQGEKNYWYIYPLSSLVDYLLDNNIILLLQEARLIRRFLIQGNIPSYTFTTTIEEN